MNHVSRIMEYITRNKSGFTLVEAIIVIAIFAALSIVLVSVLLSQHRLYRTQSAELNINDEARSSLDDIDAHIRLANKALANYSAYTSGPQTLILEIPAINSLNQIVTGAYDHVVYYLSLTTLNKVIIADAASSRVSQTVPLSVGVTAVNFNFNNQNFDLVSEISTSLSLLESAGLFNRTITVSSNSRLRNQPNVVAPLSFEVDTNGTLPNNLIAYWKLNETSGIRVDAVGNNDLTPNNAISYASGIKGNATLVTDLNSRTAQQYLSVADNPDTSLSDISFTYALWGRMNMKNDNRAVIAKGSSGASREILLEYNQSLDRFRWNVSNGAGFTGVNADNLGSPSVNVWYFIVVWHDSMTNQVGIQINNGVANILSYGNGVQDTGSILTFGTFLDVPDWYWDGRIDEVGFWKRTLTAQEKTDLWNGGSGNTIFDGSSTPPPPPPPPDVTSSASITGTFTFTGLGAGGNAALIDDTNVPAADPAGLNTNTYFRLDFGATNRHIRQITITKDPTYGVANPATMKLEYSDNDASYTQVGSTFTISAGTNPSPQVFNFPVSSSHRYWRVLYVSGTTSGNIWLREIEMME